jgi:hypothetical protein
MQRSSPAKAMLGDKGHAFSSMWPKRQSTTVKRHTTFHDSRIQGILITLTAFAVLGLVVIMVLDRSEERHLQQVVSKGAERLTASSVDAAYPYTGGLMQCLACH